MYNIHYPRDLVRCRGGGILYRHAWAIQQWRHHLAAYVTATSKHFERS